MTKDQIDELAIRVAKDRYVAQHSGTGEGINFANYAEFTHALLAELAMVHEPVKLVRDTDSSDIIDYRSSLNGVMGWTPLYTQPLPQPDLVAEIEAAYEAGYSAGYDACLEEQEE